MNSHQRQTSAVKLVYGVEESWIDRSPKSMKISQSVLAVNKGNKIKDVIMLEVKNDHSNSDLTQCMVEEFGPVASTSDPTRVRKKSGCSEEQRRLAK